MVVALDSAASPSAAGSLWLWEVPQESIVATTLPDGSVRIRRTPGPLQGMVEYELLSDVYLDSFVALTSEVQLAASVRSSLEARRARDTWHQQWGGTGYDLQGRDGGSQGLGRIVLGWRPWSSGRALIVQRSGAAGFGGTFHNYALREYGRGRFCAYRVGPD